MKIYLVDAFVGKDCLGNLAGVTLLNKWPTNSEMQSIAKEVNASETAFVVARQDQFDIRWFTPTQEVSLCVHASLSAAIVLKNYAVLNAKELILNNSSGSFKCDISSELITFLHPRVENKKIELDNEVLDLLKIQSCKKAWVHSNYLYLILDKESFNQFIPNIKIIENLEYDGLVISKLGDEDSFDFGSRCFYPKEGINEDPVTGSAHVSLAEEWGKILGKNSLKAKQLSDLGGELLISLSKETVSIGGICRIRDQFLTFK